MAENGNETGGLNHGPGTFTNNNAADLPGQTAGNQDTAQEQFAETRDDITKAEHAAAQMTETQRRNGMTRPVVSYESFKAQRQYHQPVPELSYEMPLPYRSAVDAAKFNDLQIRTHRQAMRDQPKNAAPNKKMDEQTNQNQGHLNPTTKGKFISNRFATAQLRPQPKDKNR
ncbi:MAG: hypothetical protein ABJQ70_09870 [Roseobacter sp.]